jgi:hypothetical protein
VKRKVARILRKRNQQELEAQLNLHGAMMMELCAADLFDPIYDSESQLAPEVTQITIRQSVEAAVSKKDRASLSGYVVTRHGQGIGCLRLGFNRQFSRQAAAEVSVEYSSQSAKIVAETSRQLSKHSSGSMALSVENGMIGLKLTTSRMLTESMNGTFEWDMSPDSEGVTLECSSTTKASSGGGATPATNRGTVQCTGRLAVMADNMRIGGSYSSPLSRSGRSRFKIGCSADLRGAEVEVGCGR